MDKNVSFSFKTLRFPLAILVVFIHSVGNIDAPFYNFRSFFSHEFCKFAVPVFFIISGYLFYQKVDLKFNFNLYKNKLHSRIYSLFIPYVLWNLIALIIDYIKNVTTDNSWINYNSNSIFEIIKLSILGNEMGFPINLPLWYIRDLILLCVISPAIFYILRNKKIGIIYIFILLILYLVDVGLPINIVGLLYFNIGAYFSINNINIILNRIYKYFIIALLSILTYQIYEIRFFLNFYILIMCFVMISIASKNNLISRTLNSLSKYSTIIYFSHYPISLILAIKIINILHIDYNIILYFVTPFLAAIISIMIGEIYNIIKKYVFKST